MKSEASAAEPPSAHAILSAQTAIHRLKAHYFQYVDEKDWASLAALFTPDATLSVPFWPEAKPRDQAIAAYAETMARYESVHVGLMPIIELTSRATATGIWQMQDRLYELIEGSTDCYRMMQGFGRYREEYRIEGEQWRISSLVLIRTRKDQIETITKL